MAWSAKRQAYRQFLRSLRQEAEWADGWIVSLNRKYAQPIFVLEQMPQTALAVEIAILMADYIRAEAKRLASDPQDKAERKALVRRRVDLRTSKDPLDLMIGERYRLDLKQR